MATKKILLCIDFTANSAPARRAAVDYAVLFGAELIILHVVIGDSLRGYPGFESAMAAELSEMRCKIDECVQREMEVIAHECRLRVRNVSATLRSGDPAEEIIKFADSNDVDLIVIGTHGKAGLRSRVLGGVAAKVVRTAQCPVLVVRAPVA